MEEKRTLTNQPSNDTLTLVNDPSCERCVLGTLMLNNELYHQLIEIIDSECFYDEKNRSIWDGIVSIREKGLEVDAVSLGTYFIEQGRVDMIPVFADMTSEASMANIISHASRLNDLRIRRNLYLLSLYMSNNAMNETTDILSLIGESKEKFESLMGKRASEMYSMHDTFKLMNEIIAENQKTEGFTGSPTGFSKLDRIGGLHPGWLVTVAGATAQGKTSFADCIIRASIEYNHKVAFYSMEMTREEIVSRFLSMKCGIGAGDILYSNTLTEDQLRRIDIAQREYDLSSHNLIFDDNSTSNIDNIVSSIYTMHARHGIKGAVVDYIQMLNVNMNTTNKEALMGECARKLKNIAKRLKIWVVILSQFNRDANNPVPNLDRLRDSGQIAEASDVVLLLYRAEYYHRTFPSPFENVDPKGKAMIDIAKGRNIEICRFLTNWDGKTTTFTDITENLDSVMFVNQNVPSPMEEIAPF